MATRSPKTMDGTDDEMTARAAWLHFVGGLTQSDVAERLGISAARAHRFIARAQADGLVRITVEADSAVCAALEHRLMQAHGLSFCRVAMDMPEPGPLPLRAIGAAGGPALAALIASGRHEVIGFGNGRTLSACVDAMDRTPATGVRFVSLLGGLTRSYAANPYDVIHKLAARTGAESYLMPVPLFANSAEDKIVMTGQTGLAATMDLIAAATLMVIGIGDADPVGGAASAQALEGTDTLARLRAEGAEAELLGQYLRADGAMLATELDARVMAPPLDSLRGRDVIAVAGGACKIGAISAALASGLLTGLIVDEASARRLVEGGAADHAAAAAE